MKITTAIIPSIAIAFTLASCDKPADQTPPGAPQASSEDASVKIMEARFSDTVPSEVSTIEEARTTPAKGKVTVKGTLLGRENIFADKAAIFIIGDPEKIEIEEGEAKPWIACCTPPETVKANTITVQFLDDSGNLVMKSAKGVKGLKELDEVVISGTMDESSTKEAPILNIEGISIIKK